MSRSRASCRCLRRRRISHHSAAAGGLARFAEHVDGKAQRLADRPGLERAAAWGVWGIAVGNLGEVADAGVVQAAQQRIEEAGSRLPSDLRRAAADAHPGLDEGPEEPRPDGPLMIGRVALARA